MPHAFSNSTGDGDEAASKAEKKAAADSYWEWRLGDRDKAEWRKVEKAIGKVPLQPLMHGPGSWRKATGITRRINAALFAALQELLRPVRIRDVAINILGRCDSADREAEPSELAGYGMRLEPLRKFIAKESKR